MIMKCPATTENGLGNGKLGRIYKNKWTVHILGTRGMCLPNYRFASAVVLAVEWEQTDGWTEGQTDRQTLCFISIDV